MNEQDYRIDRRTLSGDWPVLVLLALDVGFALWLWPKMPVRVPTHWNIAGQPDGFGPGWVSALAPAALALFIYAGLLFSPMLDPRRRNYRLFAEALRVVRWTLPLFAVALHIALGLNGLGYPVDVPTVIRVALPVIFMAIGNNLGRLRPNYFIGIRLPWTLASEEVWVKTHRLSGRLWVVCGLLQLGAAFLPAVWGAAVFFGLVGVMLAVPTIYSCLEFRRIGR